MTKTKYEHAEMPEDDDLHGFVDGKYVPVEVVEGKLVPRAPKQLVASPAQTR